MKTRATRRITLILVSVIFISAILSGWLISVFNGSTVPILVAEPLIKVESTPSTKIDKNIPKNLFPCLPQKVQELKLVSKVIRNKDSYFIIGIHQSSSLNQETGLKSTYQETLVKLDEIGCSLILPKEKIGSISIARYLPKELACELQMQRYRRAIAASGGREKYQKLLLDRHDESPGDLSYYFPEDICALNKLGIKVPNDARVIQDIDELKSTKSRGKS